LRVTPAMIDRARDASPPLVLVQFAQDICAFGEHSNKCFQSVSISI